MNSEHFAGAHEVEQRGATRDAGEVTRRTSPERRVRGASGGYAFFDERRILEGDAGHALIVCWRGPFGWEGRFCVIARSLNIALVATKDERAR